MHKLITALVATLTILLAGSIVGKAEAAPMFGSPSPLTKSYTPIEKVAYYHRHYRRAYRRAYRRGYYGYGYGYHRPYYGYGYRHYGYGYRRHYGYGWRY